MSCAVAGCDSLNISTKEFVPFLAHDAMHHISHSHACGVTQTQQTSTQLHDKKRIYPLVGRGFIVCMRALLTVYLARTVLFYSGVFTFLVDAYPLYAASALAANSFARSTFAGKWFLFLSLPCSVVLHFVFWRIKKLTIESQTQLYFHFSVYRCITSWDISGRPVFWVSWLSSWCRSRIYSLSTARRLEARVDLRKLKRINYRFWVLGIMICVRVVYRFGNGIGA